MPSRCTAPARDARSPQWPPTSGSTETLRTWVRQADQPGAAQTSALAKENRQLRAGVTELEPEREILPRAAKYVAGQTHW
jgi:transposase-like protein